LKFIFIARRLRRKLFHTIEGGVDQRARLVFVVKMMVVLQFSPAPNQSDAIRREHRHNYLFIQSQSTDYFTTVRDYRVCVRETQHFEVLSSSALNPFSKFDCVKSSQRKHSHTRELKRASVYVGVLFFIFLIYDREIERAKKFSSCVPSGVCRRRCETKNFYEYCRCYFRARWNIQLLI
jgi:hypothetical protein